MGRFPSRHNEISGVKKGPWTPEEDKKLVDYISENGHGCWRSLPKLSGLNRCGKSCRLRWTNYLRPDIKRGKFSEEEETTIINLHSALGNKWSKIANSLPGRTDNEIKNYWNTYLRKKLLQMGIDPNTHKPRTDLNNQLLSLSHLLNSSHLTNFIMNNNNALNLHAQQTTDQLLKIQLLQNLFQVMNYSASPNNTSTTASSAHLLGAQNISNPIQDLGFNPRYHGLDYSTNYSAKGLQEIIHDDHQDVIINPLPKLVSEPLFASSGDNAFGNQVVEKNDDQSNNNSTTFEDWETYMEDNGDTSESYWKDILELMSDSPIIP